MQEILNQLGGLVLGSLPTAILFILLIWAYGLLVRRPLTKVLNERYARTEGAMDEARAAISASESKAEEYEAKLREARAAIFDGRQQRLKQWNAERDQAIKATRQQAQQRIDAARASIEKAGEEARQHLQATSASLTAQILKIILPGSRGEAVRG